MNIVIIALLHNAVQINSHEHNFYKISEIVDNIMHKKSLIYFISPEQKKIPTLYPNTS